KVDHRVDAFGLLLDLVRQALAAPDVDVLDAAAAVPDDLQERLERRVRGALVDGGVEDGHEFVTTHAVSLPPLVWCGHGLSVTGGLLRPPRRHWTPDCRAHLPRDRYRLPTVGSVRAGSRSGAPAERREPARTALVGGVGVAPHR